jgi:hypothetical protein
LSQDCKIISAFSPLSYFPHRGNDGSAGAVEKVLFNRKEHKVGAKDAKIRTYYSALCDLCEKPLRPLRLMDFDIFNSPLGHFWIRLKQNE